MRHAAILPWEGLPTGVMLHGDSRIASHWSNLARNQYDLHVPRTDRMTAEDRCERVSHDLRTLALVNVHQDTFYISTRETVGKINDFSLGGSLGNDREEFNAALGQTALLVYTLSKKLNFKMTGWVRRCRIHLISDRYRLLPMGNRSQIQDTGNQSIYPLYVGPLVPRDYARRGLSSRTDCPGMRRTKSRRRAGYGTSPDPSLLSLRPAGTCRGHSIKVTDGIHIEPLALPIFWQETRGSLPASHRTTGMVAFLYCVSQLCRHAKQLEPKLDFPYK